jgi:hypothetical protein
MEIGTLVHVLNPGMVYANYSVIFEKLGFKNQHLNRLEETSNLKSDVWHIFDRTLHPRTNQTLYAIEDDNGVQILIEEGGIVDIKFDKKLVGSISLSELHDVYKHSRSDEAFGRYVKSLIL